MSDPDPQADERARAQAQTQPGDLSSSLRALDARAAARHDELEDRLDTVMRVLELIHDDDPSARRRLGELRASPAYEQAFDAPEPLVSVVIPTWNRIDTLLERAIPSALNQSHGNLEVIVIGDASPEEVGRSIADFGDPRVRFENLTVRGPYEQDEHRAWLASGTTGLNAGVALAAGSWIAPLGDDDEFDERHVESLLQEARARRLEFVYSRGRVLLPDGSETLLGEFPPRLTQVGLQSALYHAGLDFLELELGHALFDKPNDWGLVHRMMRVGVRIGMVEETTVTYRPSLRSQTSSEGGRVGASTDRDDDHGSPAENRQFELELELAHERTLSGELHARLEEVRRSHSWRLTAPLRRLRAHFQP